MGTQWFKGQLGLMLQRRLIRLGSTGTRGWGFGEMTCKDQLTPEGSQRRMRDEMPGEV